MKKNFRLDFKGEFYKTKTQEITGLNYIDLSDQNFGSINFHGTEKDLNKFIDKLRQKNPSLKLIGVFDLAKSLAKVSLYHDDPTFPSIYKIEDFYNFNENKPVGYCTISDITNLIKEAGNDEDVIRFLQSEKPDFMFWVDIEKLNLLIEKKPLKNGKY